VSVLPKAAMFKRAKGADPRIVRVPLTTSGATASKRLAAREPGSKPEQKVRNGLRKARLPQKRPPTADRSWTSPARWSPHRLGSRQVTADHGQAATRA
jgi:hypothetical protein